MKKVLVLLLLSFLAGSTAFAALAAFLTLVFERKRGIIAVHSSDTKEEARYIFYDADDDQRSSAGAAVQV